MSSWLLKVQDGWTYDWYIKFLPESKLHDATCIAENMVPNSIEEIHISLVNETPSEYCCPIESDEKGNLFFILNIKSEEFKMGNEENPSETHRFVYKGKKPTQFAVGNHVPIIDYFMKNDKVFKAAVLGNAGKEFWTKVE